MKGSDRAETPVLITEAAPSYDDQQAVRKRRYIIMMLMRIPFLLLAVVFFQTWWLALAFVVLSVPLPWIAVLLANDRPPRSAQRMQRYRSNQPVQELEKRDHPVIDG